MSIAPSVARLLLLPIVVALTLALALWTREPPAPSSAAGFDLARAQAIVRDVSRAPHIVTTAEHARVRDDLHARLSALGLEMDKQTDIGVRQAHRRGGAISVSPLTNMIAVLPGRDRTQPAVAVMAHYDSAPFSPGASDDGAGVAAILETARLLAAGPKPRRDVVFLLTDAEEVGLIGAQSFFDVHPLRSRIGAVVNVEARGSRGRATMFQTSTGNAGLIDLWARHAISPSGNSLAGAVYAQLPNDTDLTVPIDKGLTGINAAYIDGLYDYHMPTDTAAYQDPRSLAHLGNFALTTTRALAMAPSLPTRAGDSSYFDVFSQFVVRYPLWGGWVLVAIIVVGFAASRFTRLGASLIQSGFGMLGVFALTIIAALASHFSLEWLYGGGTIALKERTNEMGYALWVILAICTGLAMLTRVRVSGWIGAIMLLTLLAVIAQWKMAGASWLFDWAALIGVAMLWIAVRYGIASRALLLFSAIVGGLWGALLLQGVITTYMSVGPETGAPVALIIPFALVLIGPIILPWSEGRLGQWVGAGLLGLAAIGAVILAMENSFTPRNPMPGDLFHVADTKTNKSWWVTTSTPAELPPGTAERFKMDGLWKGDMWAVPGPALSPLPGPSATLVTTGGRGLLRLAGGAPHRVLVFSLKPSGPLANVTLNGKSVAIAADAPTRIAWRAPVQGEMTLEFDAGTTGAIDISYLTATPGLPPGPIQPQGPTTDWTFLSGSRVVTGAMRVAW